MPRPKRVVFLIDSDESARVTHETILRSEGYEILSAANGTRALAQVREQPPDLIVVGSKTGSMSPLQLIRLIKTDESLARVCVLVIDPGAGEIQADEYLRAGADVVLSEGETGRDIIKSVVGLIGRA